jgi:hypothetical protein
VQVAADTPIETEYEPRIKKAAAGGEPPKAGHPFFWAGYLLVDSGTVPKDEDAALAPPGLGAAKRPPAQPANPPLPPAGIQPADDTVPPAAEPSTKRPKKSKAAPRAPSKKAATRKNPAPSAGPE